MTALAAWRATGGGAFAGSRARAFAGVAAIALGVALGYAIHTVNRTAIDEFTQGIATLAGRADLSVRGPGDGFDEALYPRLARIDGVAVASPVLEFDATLPGRRETLKLAGIDVFRAAAVTPALVGSDAASLDLLAPDRVFLSAAAMATLGVAHGDELAILSGTRTVRLVVAGSIDAAAGVAVGAIDIAAAQDLAGRPGRLTRVDLRLAPGADRRAARERIAAILPAGVAAVAPAEEADLAARMTRAYRVNLDVLALVALATGALLVFTTQSLSVIRRRRAFAVLRAVGLERGRLVASLVAEGALLGAIGAVVGVAVGHALASAFLAFVGGDLGAGYFRGQAPAPSFAPGWAALFALAGIVAAMAGAWLPAREAGRAAPAAALKAGDDETVFARLAPAGPGLACLALALVLLPLPPFGGLPWAGYASIALMLAGVLLLLPWIARLLVAHLPTPRAPAAALAIATLRESPGQATVSLASIVAAVSLAVSMAIMVTSFRASLGHWLDQVLPADVYLRAGTSAGSGWFDAADRVAIAALPGVARATFSTSVRIVPAAGQASVALLVRERVDPDGDGSVPVVGPVHAPRPGEPPPAWISEAYADRAGARAGDRVVLPIAGRDATFTVAGVWRDYARLGGAVVIERPAWLLLGGDDRTSDAAIALAPGASLDALRNAIDARFGRDRLVIATAGEIRAISLAIFERTFAVTWALEAAAIAIGLVGLSAAFGAIALARRREFGVLRHLGMTRRGLGAMLACEGAIVSAVGLVIGCTLGFAVSLVLIHVVNRQSFGWSMDFAIPAGGLAGFAAAMLALATLTAWWSARRAVGDDVVAAVREDW